MHPVDVEAVETLVDQLHSKDSATVRAAADELGALLSVKEHGEARAGASLAPLCLPKPPRLTRRCLYRSARAGARQ